MSIQRINAGPRMSSAVVHGNTVYLAGLTADDARDLLLRQMEADARRDAAQLVKRLEAETRETAADRAKAKNAKGKVAKDNKTRALKVMKKAVAALEEQEEIIKQGGEIPVV